MFCNKCGATIADGSVVCNACGNPINNPAQAIPPQQPTYQQTPYQQPTYQQVPQQPMYQAAPQQPMYGQAPQQPTYQQVPYQQTPYQQPMFQQPGLPLAQPDMPMNWFKFLIYFSLIASAVINVLSSITLLTGAAYETPYGNLRDLAYEIFEGLAIVEGLAMLSGFVCAVLAIVARMKLAKYKKDGPKMLQLLYIIAAVSNVIVLFGYIAILGDDIGDEVFVSTFSSCVANTISNIVYMIVNKIYFDKRKHLFVN